MGVEGWEGMCGVREESGGEDEGTCTGEDICTGGGKEWGVLLGNA